MGRVEPQGGLGVSKFYIGIYTEKYFLKSYLWGSNFTLEKVLNYFQKLQCYDLCYDLCASILTYRRFIIGYRSLWPLENFWATQWVQSLL